MNPQEYPSVDPKALAPNPWNTNSCSPELEKKLDASVKKLDMFKPIVVRTMPDGTLQILGGQHRAESAVRVGLSKVPVFNLGTITDKKAKEIGLVDNARYGSDDTVALARLLEELGSVEDITAYMPFSDADMSSIFSSMEIDLDALDMTEDEMAPRPVVESTSGKVQTHQTMRFRVPTEDVQNISDKLEKIMKLQGFDEKDSLINAGDALVWLLARVEV